MTISVLSYNIHALLSKLGPNALSHINPRVDKSYRLFSDLHVGIAPDLILLQEVNVSGITITAKNFPYHLFPQYNVYFANNYRTAILAHSTNLNTAQLDISRGGKAHTHTYASCWIEVRQPRSDPIILCSLYRPGTCPTTDLDSFWDEYKSALHRSSSVYICGDINAEHGLWGAPDNNSDGTYFAIKFLELGLTPVILPSPSYASFSNSAESYIDVTCSTAMATGRISNWRFDFRYDVDSDHHPISFDILGEKSSTASTYEVWNLRDANWDLFARDLSAALDNWQQSLTGFTTPNQAAESWSAAVVGVARQRIGKVAINTGRARLWWHSGIRKLIARKHRTRKLAQRTKLPRDRQVSRRAKRDVDRAVAAAKESYWTRLIARLNGGKDKDFCRLYRQVCNDKTRGIPPLQVDPDDHKSICSSNVEKSQLLLQTFKSAAIGGGTSDNNKMVQDFVEEIQPSLTDVFPSSAERISKLIKGMPSGKAFGSDGIHPDFLKHGGDLVAVTLCRLFTLCWQLGEFPTIWKKGKICPISKRPKPTPNPRDYRPISLLSVVGKLYESILVFPLRHLLLANGAISSYQSGFLPARNCEEQIIRIVEDVLYQFECRSAVTAIFLDISKAYDSVWRDGLRYKLAQSGVTGNLLAAVSSFLVEGPRVSNSTMFYLRGRTSRGVCPRVPDCPHSYLFSTSMTWPKAWKGLTWFNSHCMQTMWRYGLNPALVSNTNKQVLNFKKLSTLSNLGVDFGVLSSTPTNAKQYTSHIAMC